jgi:hypothetical protein
MSGPNLSKKAKNHHISLSAKQWNFRRKQEKTDPRLHSFGFRVAEEWNALSDDMKSLEKIETFKSQIRREREQ